MTLFYDPGAWDRNPKARGRNPGARDSDPETIFHDPRSLLHNRRAFRRDRKPYFHDSAAIRRSDLHALHKTFGTALVLSGTGPSVVMEAMRHSNPKPTMIIYTDASQLELGNSLAKLPAVALSGVA